MCSQYELKTDLDQLPDQFKNNMPKGLLQCYEHQYLIKPNDPVLALRQEHKAISSSIMLWGFLPHWSKDPMHSFKPFNARAETVQKKVPFREAWRHRRCLLPATGFFEKDKLIRKQSYQAFWLGGIWERWLGADGSEIESCLILTTKPNSLIKPLHKRMPVIIPQGLEEKWLEQTDAIGLKSLQPILNGWDPEGWSAKPRTKSKVTNHQLTLFS